MRTRVALATMCLSAVVVVGQSPQSVSGTWKLNPSASQPAQPGQPEIMMTVTQTADEVSVSVTGSRGTSVKTYRLGQDNSESNGPGMVTKVHASWQGAQLVFKGNRVAADGRQATFHRTMTPSADGAQLSVEEIMDTTNTHFKSVRVYDRVK